MKIRVIQHIQSTWLSKRFFGKISDQRLSNQVGSHGIRGKVNVSLYCASYSPVWCQTCTVLHIYKWSDLACRTMVCKMTVTIQERCSYKQLNENIGSLLRSRRKKINIEY